MTEFGDALVNAITEKDNDITRFVWKEANGQEIKLIDMSEDDLRKAYLHCIEMLYNTNKFNPGKEVIKKYVNHTYDNCNAELFYRYIIYEMNIPTLKSPKDLMEFITAYKTQNKVANTDYVTEIFENIPKIFETVTIEKLLSAILDTLDVLNKRRLISDKFIISLGIWLTDKEKQDLAEFDEKGNPRNRLDVIRERLILNNVKLKLCPSGLNYTEFRNLVTLKAISKYSQISTDTLKLLRDKVLLLVNNNLDYHIEKWNMIKSQIELVAKSKNINNLNEIKK